jgi:signal transduction histidine kinase/ActR/RegA family two-component response regulator
MTEGLMLQMEKRGEVITRFLAETLANPLYLYDMEEVYELLSATRQQKDILYAYVFDVDGNILQDGTKDVLKFGKRLNDDAARISLSPRNKLLIKTHDEVMDVSMPLWIGDKPLGGIMVGLSLRGIHAHIGKIEYRLNQIKQSGMHRTIVSLIATTVGLSIVGICMALFFAARLIRPIKELVDYANRVGKGKYDFELSSEQNDEIGELIDAFNQMKFDLQQRTVSIDDLEKRVDSRTKALGNTNNDLQFEIAERSKAEELLKRHQEHLEERINERTSDLTKLNKQLKQEIEDRQIAEKERESIQIRLLRAEKMEAVGTLAGGVAHDLNNILAGIVSYPELLLLDIEKNDPLKKPLKTILDSGKKAAEIVQDLLTMARRGASVTEIIDMEQIVDDYLNSAEFEKMMSYHPGVSITKNIDSKLLRILGSAVHLSKTVMNLASNAAESISGVGTIHITLENRSVDMPIKGYENVTEGDYVVLTVSDTGTGIPAEDIERIFEPFYTKKVMGRSGTGLGMAVVWGTVKDHNGYIEVKSEVGKGTQFDLYFPGTRQEISSKNTAVSIDAYEGNETILVVDDVEKQRIVACSILKRLGYEAEAVSSGEEAVAYIKQQSVDLLVLDMIMSPGIDGLETYKRIRALIPNQKAIIASGFSETDRVKKAQALGAGAYIKKPYMLENIGAAIRAELDGN